MKVPLLDLRAQYASIKGEIDAAIHRVLDSQGFILGPEVEALEREIADYCGVKHGIGVASGSDALALCVPALGIGPGDEVITTPYSFFATASCIARADAKPVFVDIDPDTYNIDASLIERVVTARTRAILPVHLYGQCAQMDVLMDIARRRGLKVLEDAAQAIGADFRGQRACSMGDAGILSFYPTKNLGGLGDAGMVLTSDDALADKLRLLRAHGMRPKYYHQIVGWNSRMDALQAAGLRAKLPHLEDWVARRIAVADGYDRGFAGSGVKVPHRGGTGRHVFHQYVIAVDDRDGLAEHLRKREIGFELYYPLPLHLQACFSEQGYRQGDLPVAEAAARRTLALPIYPELTSQQQQYVIDAVREFCG